MLDMEKRAVYSLSSENKKQPRSIAKAEIWKVTFFPPPHFLLSLLFRKK